jgi:hypothetical protein
MVNEPPATALPTATAPEPPPIDIVAFPPADIVEKVTDPVVDVEASNVKADATWVSLAL